MLVRYFHLLFSLAILGYWNPLCSLIRFADSFDVWSVKFTLGDNSWLIIKWDHNKEQLHSLVKDCVTEHLAKTKHFCNKPNLSVEGKSKMFLFYRPKFENLYFDLLYSAAAHAEPEMVRENESICRSNRITERLLQSSEMDGDAGQIFSTEKPSSGHIWYSSLQLKTSDL